MLEKPTIKMIQKEASLIFANKTLGQVISKIDPNVVLGSIAECLEQHKIKGNIYDYELEMVKSSNIPLFGKDTGSIGINLKLLTSHDCNVAIGFDKG